MKSADNPSPPPVPVDVAYSRSRRMLLLRYADGGEREIAATLLRTESPSAEVQGHAPHERKIVTGKENVAIIAIEPVGNYALRLVFDDGHQTGL